MNGTPAKIGNEWGGVRMKEPANPGDVVTVTTQGGKSFKRRLVSVHKQFPDAVVWQAEEVNDNGAGGGTGPGQFSPGPQSSGQASPAPPATGPAGPVLASSMVQAALSAYADAILAEWPAEQAGSLACTIAIGVQRGAVNDLVDADPFAGN